MNQVYKIHLNICMYVCKNIKTTIGMGKKHRTWPNKTEMPQSFFYHSRHLNFSAPKCKSVTYCDCFGSRVSLVVGVAGGHLSYAVAQQLRQYSGHRDYGSLVDCSTPHCSTPHCNTDLQGRADWVLKKMQQEKV